MKYRANARAILAFTLALICILAFPTIAFATDISVTADSTNVNAGDTITVTVTVTAPNMAVADGVFTYDPALLSYISSNGGASDGYINMVSMQSGGADSLTAVIKFVAIGAGDAIVDVSIESVLDYNEQQIGGAQAGVNITITSTDSDTEEPGQSTPPVDISLTGVAAQNVMGSDTQMYIWRSLSTLTLPSGFTDRQIMYSDEYVGGAAIPDIEDFVLLYLSDAAGESSGYYIYDEQRNLLFPYRTMSSVSAKFTLIWIGDDITIPDGFTPTTLSWKGADVPAWAEQGSDGSVYLVYARSASGEMDFYLYNIEDESMQRYIAFAATAPAPTAAPTAEPTPAPTEQPIAAQTDKDASGAPISSTMLIVLIAAGCLFALLTIVFLALYIKASHRLKKTATTKKSSKNAIYIKDADV